MAITIGDTSVSTALTGSSTTDYSFTHVVSATSNLLIVAVFIQQDSSRSVDSVTFNGDALTKLIGAESVTDPAHVQVELWYRLNPDTGSHSVRVQDASESSGSCACAIDAYVPSIANAQIKNSTDTGTTDPSIAVPCTKGQSLAVLVATHQAQTARTPSAGTTEFCDLNMDAGTLKGRAWAGYQIVTGESSVTMQSLGDNSYWAGIGASFGNENGGSFLLNLI